MKKLFILYSFFYFNNVYAMDREIQNTSSLECKNFILDTWRTQKLTFPNDDDERVATTISILLRKTNEDENFKQFIMNWGMFDFFIHFMQNDESTNSTTAIERVTDLDFEQALCISVRARIRLDDSDFQSNKRFFQGIAADQDYFPNNTIPEALIFAAYFYNVICKSLIAKINELVISDLNIKRRLQNAMIGLIITDFLK